MKLLHLDSSILGAHSVSRTLSAAVVARLKEIHPAIQTTSRDLAAQPIPPLTGPYVAVQRGSSPPDPALAGDLALGQTLMTEFLEADIVVIGVSLYNFGISSQLKTWVDRIVVAGKTFSYSEKGPVGLAAGKRAILTVARGGVYAAGTPFAPFEHAESYMRCVLGFMGITHPQVFIAEGVGRTDQREKAVQTALQQIAEIKE